MVAVIGSGLIGCSWAALLDLIRTTSSKPEIEVFNPGEILLARKLIDDSQIGQPRYSKSAWA